MTATSAAGTSVASGTVTVTPNSTPVPPAITSAATTTFTVLAPNTFTVTATGTPPPAITQSGGSLPTGITFNSGILSGTPAAGTVGSYPLTMTATGTAPAANQSFTLTIAKANQSITFNNPGARNFSATPFTIAATSTSGINVAFTSNTPSVCTVLGTSVTMVTTGVCSISADVASTSDFNAANTITQGFSISPASQNITFGAQSSPRNFSTSAFAISPLATSSSGLTVIYSSTTPSVCSVSGSNVLPITAGVCTIAANQGGNANFNAASQATQSVTINPVAPGAPTIGTGSGSDQQVNIGFTPPLSNGGSPISQYNASCTPSGTGSGAASPVAVTGLINGTPYTCSVTATNAAALTGPASGTVTVTPTSANGAALWLSVCDVCHTQVPAGNQLNGAGSTATVLNYVRATQQLMMNNSAVQALTQAELAAIAAYIGNVVPVNEVTTAFNTAVPIEVSSHITLNTISFTSVEVVTPPTNGVLSAFTGTSATYTPNPGFSGVDTFTYRGTRAGPSLTGDPRTVTVTVVGQMPVISSPLTLNGTFGQSVNYQITASGAPTSFGAADLPAALSVDTGTGAITGVASVVGSFNSTISATNGNGTGNASLNIVVAKAPQTITFGAQTSPRAFSVGGSFAIAPLATGGASGNSLAYSATTPGVCAVVGTTVNIVSAGLCTLAVNQAGNANYSDAVQVTQNVSITPVAPAAPTLDDAAAGVDLGCGLPRLPDGDTVQRHEDLSRRAA
ncbi:MAG: putative Ig domain-containing protein [Usitatibacteraceae bacterium]